MRGEKADVVLNGAAVKGSPPHARGKGACPIMGSPKQRITPACAGKSGCYVRIYRVIRDHPRMRGEKGRVQDYGGRYMGSPPHARGKVPAVIVYFRQKGITPACAGKRQAQSRLIPVTLDHPRMRGEKFTCDSSDSSSGGSPPHARGKVEYSKEQIVNGRITPACAGKSALKRQLFFLRQDHPRMRGEKDYTVNTLQDEIGSPPHARGKAIRYTASTIQAWDHPRMRGEKTKKSLSQANPFHPFIKSHSV